MGQRLWRTKAKIRDARIPFDLPERRELRTRLGTVLEAVSAAFGTAWDNLHREQARIVGLAEEAIFLGRLLTTLRRTESETFGLLALMLFAVARRSAAPPWLIHGA